MFPSNEASLSYGPKTNETSGTFQVFGLFLAGFIVHGSRLSPATYNSLGEGVGLKLREEIQFLGHRDRG